MQLSLDDLTVDPNEEEVDSLLDAWRWLVPEDAEPLLIAACGDLFVRTAAGAVHLLDTVEGRLEKVAESTEEFEAALRRPRDVRAWFRPQLVAALKASGLSPAAGECYSFIQPIVLGGKMEPSNVECTDALVHFHVLGQIHEQVKDLPPGTPIKGIKIE